MGQHSQILVHTAKSVIGYAEMLVKDVGKHNYARKPTWGIGGEVINCNHPAFVFGHLALYPPKILGLIGKDPTPANPPPGFTELFDVGKQCQDDPNGTIYPPLEKITTAFFRGMAAAMDAVAKMNDAELLKPNPVERMAKNFPTVGAGVNFLLSPHVAIHLGQISTWRRTMGLPSAKA